LEAEIVAEGEEVVEEEFPRHDEALFAVHEDHSVLLDDGRSPRLEDPVDETVVETRDHRRHQSKFSIVDSMAYWLIFFRIRNSALVYLNILAVLSDVIIILPQSVRKLAIIDVIYLLMTEIEFTMFFPKS
jgi:hypothetical protein